MSDLPTPNRHPVLRRYLKDVLAWHGYVRFLGMPTLQNTPDVPLDDLYVGQSVSRQYLSPENEPAEQDLLNPVQMLLENRCMVVLGDPGSGKSTLINWFAWYLASGFENRLPNGLANALPVPIILRELSLNNVSSFSDLIDAALQRPVAAHLERKILDEYINNGSVLFLVDGLDELSVESRNIVRKALGEGMENLSQSFFLITSRVVGYEHIQRSYLRVDSGSDYSLSEDESAISMDFPKNILNQKLSVSWVEENVSTFYIAPFSDKQISQFSFNWYKEQMDGVDVSARLLRDQFINSIFSDENTRRLSRTPHLLTMMALIFRKRAHLPNGRAILYDAIAQAYLESIDQARGLKDEYDWQSKKLWLAKVAFEMQLQRSLDTETEELLVDKAVVLNWIKTSIASFQHQVDDQYAEEFLSWIARRSGLLLPRGQEQYAFLHLSFQEYFAAVYIQSQLENPSWIDKEDEQSLDSRVDIDTLAKWANETSWSQTLIFLFELMSKKTGWGKRIWKYLFPFEKCEKQVSSWIESLDTFVRPPLIDLKLSLLSNRHCYIDATIQDKEVNEIFSYSLKEKKPARDFLGVFVRRSLFNVILANDVLYANYVKYLVPNYNRRSFELYGVDLFSKPEIVEFLEMKKDITNLSLYNCNLDNLGFLTGMPDLDRLVVRKNRINKIPENLCLKFLERADLSNNCLNNVEFLRFSKGLRYLNLRGNNISDLSAIFGLKNLVTLHLDYVSDIRLFDGLDKIINFSMKSKSQAVIERVFNCENLVHLDLSGSEISSISNIGKLKNLKIFEADNLILNDWFPILNNFGLEILSIDGNSNIDSETIKKLEARGVKIIGRPLN